VLQLPVAVQIRDPEQVISVTQGLLDGVASLLVRSRSAGAEVAPSTEQTLAAIDSVLCAAAALTETLLLVRFRHVGFPLLLARCWLQMM
jgi:hypothetical protein